MWTRARRPRPALAQKFDRNSRAAPSAAPPRRARLATRPASVRQPPGKQQQQQSGAAFAVPRQGRARSRGTPLGPPPLASPQPSGGRRSAPPSAAVAPLLLRRASPRTAALCSVRAIVASRASPRAAPGGRAARVHRQLGGAALPLRASPPQRTRQAPQGGGGSGRRLSGPALATALSCCLLPCAQRPSRCALPRRARPTARGHAAWRAERVNCPPRTLCAAGWAGQHKHRA